MAISFFDQITAGPAGAAVSFCPSLFRVHPKTSFISVISTENEVFFVFYMIDSRTDFRMNPSINSGIGYGIDTTISSNKMSLVLDESFDIEAEEFR